MARRIPLRLTARAFNPAFASCQAQGGHDGPGKTVIIPGRITQARNDGGHDGPKREKDQGGHDGPRRLSQIFDFLKSII